MVRNITICAAVAAALGAMASGAHPAFGLAFGIVALLTTFSKLVKMEENDELI